MKTKQPGPLSELIGYAGNYTKLTYISLVLAGITAIASLMPFVYLWRIIKEVIEVSPDYTHATDIVYNGWMAVGFSVLAMMIYIAALMCSHLSAFRVAANLKKTLLKHIGQLPVGFSDDIGTGRLRRVVLDTTASTETLLAHNLPDMAQALITPLCMLVLLFLFDWRFGVACLSSVLVSFLCMFRMAGPSMANSMKQYQNALEKMSNEAVEYVRGIPVVKTFGQTVFSFHRFKKSIDDYGNFCLKYTKSCRSPMVMFTVIINASFAFLIGLTMYLANDGVVAQDVLINFLFYVIFTPIIVTMMNRVMFLSENTMVIHDAMKRIREIMDIQPLPEAVKPCTIKQFDVELSHVTYRYAEDATPAVHDLSLCAKQNQVIALVGPSGSGKTTAAALIARFFDTQEGTVSIGGIPVREIPKETLMNTVSYVFQDSKLLKRSILDNLRIAKPDASEDEICEALRLAQCEDMMTRFPKGINTILGSEGTYLSGGEQQRIAIARAILKKAPVVILDEATAFADPENEVLVQKAFTALTKQSTVIMIAHRLSTIRNADQIYVLNKGTVVEHGTHQELLDSNGLYQSMWTEYQKAASWKVGENNE